MKTTLIKVEIKAIFEELKELQANLEDFSSEELIEHRGCVLERINKCLEILGETSEDNLAQEETDIEKFLRDWLSEHNDFDKEETEFWDFYVGLEPDIKTSNFWKSQNKPDEEFQDWFNSTEVNEIIIKAAKDIVGYTDYDVWCN